MTWRYPLEFTLDDNDTLLVTSAAFPEVTSFGADEAEAQRNGEQAVLEAIAARMATGAAIPPPAAGGDAGPAAVVPTLATLKIELYARMKADKVSKAEMGRRLGQHPPQVQRLFDIDHQSQASQIDDAFRVLGYEVHTSVHARKLDRIRAGTEALEDGEALADGEQSLRDDEAVQRTHMIMANMGD